MSTYKTRARLLDSSRAILDDNLQEVYLFNYGHCEDETHPMDMLGIYPSNIGGSFLSVTARMEFNPVSDYIWADAFGLRWDHVGPIIAYPQYAPTSPVSESWWRSDYLLDSSAYRVGLGATAIARCKPATPKVDLAVSIAELYREGIPSTLKQFAHMKDEVRNFRALTKAQKGKVAPSKYLEYQFGWKPLVSDIRKASRALLDQEKILEDLRRNSGRRMRRRYEFPATSSESEIVRDNTRPWPNPNLYVLQQSGNFVVTRSETKKTWFSGEFIYTFPGADAGIPSQMIAGARQLLGLTITPETIWNVAPWTWLTDWFANTGDVVSNVTAIGSDDLLMRYGYLMQEAQVVYDHAHHGVSVAGGNIPSIVRGKAVYTAKSRIAASPFGFGLTFDGLDPRQIAILASIGITRQSRR